MKTTKNRSAFDFVFTSAFSISWRPTEDSPFPKHQDALGVWSGHIDDGRLYFYIAAYKANYGRYKNKTVYYVDCVNYGFSPLKLEPCGFMAISIHAVHGYSQQEHIQPYTTLNAAAKNAVRYSMSGLRFSGCNKWSPYDLDTDGNYRTDKKYHGAKSPGGK